MNAAAWSVPVAAAALSVPAASASTGPLDLYNFTVPGFVDAFVGVPNTTNYFQVTSKATGQRVPGVTVTATISNGTFLGTGTTSLTAITGSSGITNGRILSRFTPGTDLTRPIIITYVIEGVLVYTQTLTLRPTRTATVDDAGNVVSLVEGEDVVADQAAEFLMQQDAANPPGQE